MTNQISTATNISSPNLSSDPNNPQKYFNNIFALDFSIGATRNDAINAYFEEYTGSASAGDALAAAVMYTATAQGVNPMSIIDQFKKLAPGELNNYLTAFLNINRVPTSQLGIRQTGSNPNPMVLRAILP